MVAYMGEKVVFKAMQDVKVMVATIVMVVGEEEVHIIPIVKGHAISHKDQEEVKAMALGEVEEDVIINLIFNLTSTALIQVGEY